MIKTKKNVEQNKTLNDQIFREFSRRGRNLDAMRLRIHGGVIDATRCRDIVRCVAVSDVLQQPLLKLSLQPLHP